MEHFDVLIVGAGLSGIGAAWHLQDRCQGKSYAILEGRAASGGTWDLFRYPGVRSDSDMYTLGYRFRPWKEAKAIADGPSILKYIREVASDHGIDKKIRYQHRVVAASWSTLAARWTVEVERGEARELVRFTCSFLWMCSGYYRTDAGYLPDFPGIDRFKGEVVHPQKWTDDIDYVGKKVVVIGSGATAVTLVPAMADSGAAHVTMLQRSPTYMAVRPSQDPFATRMRARLPLKLAYMVTRWKNVLLGMYFYQMCMRRPEKVKNLLLGYVRQMLGPDYDVGTHFTPRYAPWDQRLCLVPDADFFRAIRRGKVSVVTDHIETFTERGIQLKSGQVLEADVVVSATGFNLSVLGDIRFSVDGQPLDFGETVTWRGAMFTGVPNMAWVFGYFRASWTLRADLVSALICRLLTHMDALGTRFVVPALRPQDDSMALKPWVDPENFNPGYLIRGVGLLPRQGSHAPWLHSQDYWTEKEELPVADLDDGTLVYR